MFGGFCEDVLLGPSPNGAVVRKVDRAADFFVAVGRGFPSPRAIGGSGLRALFGSEALRRAEAPAAYLCRMIGFRWDDDPAIPVEVSGCDQDSPLLGPSERLMADYRQSLDRACRGRARAPRTKSAYIRAAKALMSFAARDGRSVPNDRDVRRLLWRTPGVRASLGPFLTWMKLERNVAVMMPRRARRDRKASEGRLVAGTSSLMRALELTPGPVAGRALLAACASRLFGLPLELVLSLTWEDVVRDGKVSLRIEGLVIEMPARLVAQFDRLFVSGRRGLIFPGRSGQKPLSAAAVLHHVAKSRGTR